MGMQGIENFRRQLQLLDKKLRNKTISQALRRGAKVMANAVKANARRQTGALKKSVKVRTGKRKKDRILMRVVVTGGHPDSVPIFEEYGTADQAAHPFVRPAFVSTKGSVTDQIFGEIKRGIEESGKS